MKKKKKRREEKLSVRIKCMCAGEKVQMGRCPSVLRNIERKCERNRETQRN